jgi:hypothetical protein
MKNFTKFVSLFKFWLKPDKLNGHSHAFLRTLLDSNSPNTYRSEKFSEQVVNENEIRDTAYS